jgi:hypothetical protein
MGRLKFWKHVEEIVSKDLFGWSKKVKSKQMHVARMYIEVYTGRIPDTDASHAS